MCFEFEALYWAKVAEEELKKKEALKRAAVRGTMNRNPCGKTRNRPDRPGRLKKKNPALAGFFFSDARRPRRRTYPSVAGARTM
jgi:hypothetical protein